MRPTDQWALVATLRAEVSQNRRATLAWGILAAVSLAANFVMGFLLAEAIR